LIRKRQTWPPPLPHPASEAESLRRRPQWQPARWVRLPTLAMCLVAWLLSWTAPAVHAQTTTQDIGAGSLEFRNGSGTSAEAPRLRTTVNMQITGIVARVEVKQQFRNQSDQWVEGVYSFPLPENAAVDQLRMEIGERVIVGEIREKVEAQKLYEQARANGQHASVVHQNRPNLFRTSVANIAPGEVVDIAIGYLQIVDQDAGRYGLRFPLTITPRYTPGGTVDDAATQVAQIPPAASDTPTDFLPALMHPDTTRQSVSFNIDIDAGTDLEQINSAWHAITIDRHGRRAHVQLREREVAPDRDFELSWQPIVHGEPAVALFREHTDAGEHALLMFMPPQDPTPVVTPREVIFVIDTSGSMAGSSIEQAQAALLKGLDTLTPADRFTIIEFNSTFEYLFEQPVQVTDETLLTARHWVASLHADGGTEMLPALTKALAMPTSESHLRQVLFITDGAVSNEDELLRLINEHLAGARLFTVGIGSAPNGYFMRKAAQMGRGTFTYIGSTSEVDEKMSALFHKVTHPVLTDIELHWPNNLQPEYAPAKIADLYAGEPVVVSARMQGKSNGMLIITGRTGGAWTRQVSLDSVESRSGVATLWARNRISDLMDAGASGASDVAIRGQVLPLALQYQLVSKYTSLIAVDKTPARPAGEALESRRLDSTKPQGLDWPANAYPRTATAAQLQILIGVALMLFALALVCLQRRRAGAV